VLAFFVFFRYLWRKHKRLPWNFSLVFAITGLSFLGITWLHSGAEALWLPYGQHLGRGHNYESLFYHIGWLLDLIGLNLFSSLGYLLFLSFQFASVPWLLMAPIDKEKDVLRYSAVAIGLFILFSKFYSPQWILWLSPFWVLLVQRRVEIWILVAFDVCTYLYFPIAYKNLGVHSLGTAFFVLAKNACLIVILWWLLRDLVRQKNYLKKRCNAPIKRERKTSHQNQPFLYGVR
jgi:hypothetical protein